MIYEAFSTGLGDLQEAKAQACSIVFLPECVSFIGANQEEVCVPSFLILHGTVWSTVQLPHGSSRPSSLAQHP